MRCPNCKRRLGPGSHGLLAILAAILLIPLVVGALRPVTLRVALP